MNKLPKICENLLIQELNDEVLIYDLITNKSYCLNETAKAVFNACDGQQTFADVKLPEEIVYLSLDELKKQDLIKGDYASPFAGLSRREAIRKVGLASLLALPVVAVLVAPTAISAASANCSCTAASNLNARTQGCPCVSNNDCCGVCIFNNGSPICSAPTPAAQPTAAACCPRIIV
jgi:hypothetical protein